MTSTICWFVISGARACAWLHGGRRRISFSEGMTVREGIMVTDSTPASTPADPTESSASDSPSTGTLPAAAGSSSITPLLDGTGERGDIQPDSVQWLSALDRLPHYVPGAPAAVGSYKLSSNEVPSPPATAIVAALVDAIDDLNRYPSMYADHLVSAIAELHGVSPEKVVVGNGSVALIELILRSVATAGDEVIYAWRSFEAYPIAAELTGGRSVKVPNDPSGGHDLEAMAAAVTENTKAILICTPNNPTSQSVSHRDLVAFLNQIPPGVLVVIDEAYWHFDTGTDRIRAEELLASYKNVIVLRTFSKAYGLAGLRIGYALGRKRLMRRLRVAATPFGVNALAQVAALAALRTPETAVSVVGEVVAERERVVSALQDQGWNLGVPQGNFIWLPVAQRSEEFARFAAERGIVVRPFSGDGVRITIGESEANDLLIEITAQWLSVQSKSISASSAVR